MDVSAATTGSTLNPVMNLISSMAKMLLGSAMATVRTLPVRLMGMTWCFWAISDGMSLMTVASISKCERLMEGTPYWRLRKDVMSSSLMNPSLTRLPPIRPPPVCCCWRAWFNCSRVIRAAFTNISPRRTAPAAMDLLR